MEENKEKVTTEETTVTEGSNHEISENNRSEQNTPKQSKKKRIVLSVVAILIGFIAYFLVSYVREQQEARRIDVAFNHEEAEVAYGTDLMSLITVNKADEVTVNLVDKDWNEVTELKANIEYKAVYTCMAADNVQTLEKTIIFIDSVAPVINGVKETQEIAFGSEFDALNGVTANDDVDGDVDVILSGDEVNTKAPKEYNLVYTAKDLSDNTVTVKSTVKVLEPTCGTNASWNGEDCVCNQGYQGNAWTGCTAIPVKKPANNNQPVSSGKSQAQLDCEASWGTWKDNSWCDWNSSNNSESSSSGNSGSGSANNNQSCYIPPFEGGIYPTMDACKVAGESGKSGGLSWICYDAYDTCGNHLGYGLAW